MKVKVGQEPMVLQLLFAHGLNSHWGVVLCSVLEGLPLQEGIERALALEVPARKVSALGQGSWFRQLMANKSRR